MRVLAGRYELVRFVGRGGMGEVWEGRDRVIERRVAVKLLPHHKDDARSTGLFFREARTAGALHHPGVVTVFDLGQDDADGSLFLVMEFIEGRDLASLLAGSGAPPVPTAVDWTAQAAGALARAHAKGVVHRDLKPSNLMVTDDGVVKILDFGIARFTESTNGSSKVMGTLAYMPPERFDEQPGDARSDLYSLGCVLHELLTGKVPFAVSGPIAMMNAHLRRAPARPGHDRPGVPAELDDLVVELLAKDPRDRPATADDVQQRLRALTAPIAAAPPTRTGRGNPPGARPTEPNPAAPPPAAAVPAAPTATGSNTPRPALAGPWDDGPAAELPSTVYRAAETASAPPWAAPTTPAASADPQGPDAPDKDSESSRIGGPGDGRRTRRSRSNWALLSLVLTLVAAAVVGFAFLPRNDHSVPNCFPEGSGSGVPPVAVHAIAPGTPHAPTLVAPASRATAKVGRPIELRWQATGPVSKVSTKLGDGTWQDSPWMNSTRCMFTPPAAGLYKWATNSASAATGATGGPWSSQRYLFVQSAEDDSTPNPVRDTPDAPNLVSPPDQTIVKAGQPVELTRTGSALATQWTIEYPDGQWRNTPWEATTSFTFTPPSPGTYRWGAFVASRADCGAHTDCLSPASEQRYLIVQ
ncbi:protein kinase domain-containing protein [Embleya sp. NPDC001921]